ncbi:MAG: UDP-N-acetylmuramate dehydrogenase, partial [Chitinophagaceae bacterium]
MHELIQNKDLTHFNTFHIKAIAKLFTSISTLEDIQIIYELKNEKLLVLGGGSNILFTDDFDGLVLYNQIKGIKVIKEDDDHVWVKVGGGEQWHSFVEYCIDKGYGGVENLALIPGSVGASPMQNIGAYGVEIKDVVDQIEAYHIKDKAVCFFSAKECEFGYRDSVFKKKWKDQFIILNVTFQLSKKPVFNISYGAIKKELESKGIHDLSLRSIADAVIAIRSSKLPDPAKIGNAGSFFKNPIITSSQFSTLQNMYPDIVGYEESHSSK